MGNEASNQKGDSQKPPETRKSLVLHPKQDNNQWRIRFQHPHLLQTLGGQQEGNYYRYYFEFCDLTLASLLQERYGTKKYFPEEDLQALLLGISSALSFLQEQGISHGDICPSEIYFDASSSSFKILDSSLINGRASGMQQVLSGKLKYLSPECYQVLGQPLTEEILYKNDIWCLGMTILESSILKPSETIYQTGLHPAAIQERLAEVASVYNQTFANTILLMLNFNEKERPDPINLFNYLLNLQRVAEFQNTQQIPTFLPQPQVQTGLRTLQGSPQRCSPTNSQIQSQQASRYQNLTPTQYPQPSQRPRAPALQRNIQTDSSPKQFNQVDRVQNKQQTIMCQPTITQLTPTNNTNDIFKYPQQSPVNQQKVYPPYCQLKNANQSPTSYGANEQITPQKIFKIINYQTDQERSPSSKITPSRIQQQILNNYDPPARVLSNITNTASAFGQHQNWNLTKTQHLQPIPNCKKGVNQNQQLFSNHQYQNQSNDYYGQRQQQVRKYSYPHKENY